MAVLRPWIRKIQVNALDLIRSKHLLNMLRIHTDKEKISKSNPFLFFIGFPALDRTDQNTGELLNPNKINIRISSGKLRDELSLTHTNLNVDRVIIAENSVPISLVLIKNTFIILIYRKRTVGNTLSGTFHISKSHFEFLLTSLLYLYFTAPTFVGSGIFQARFRLVARRSGA